MRFLRGGVQLVDEDVAVLADVARIEGACLRLPCVAGRLFERLPDAIAPLRLHSVEAQQPDRLLDVLLI